MNEIERAIAWMEDAILQTDEIFDECSPALQKELAEQKEHFVVALQALREKAEREKGCNICEEDNCAICQNLCGDGELCRHFRKSNYCYWCGRKLRKEAT